MSGLYGLPDYAEFSAEEWDANDGTYGYAVYATEVEDEPPILVLSGVADEEAYDLAHLLRRLLDAEHAAVVAGYDGVVQRLAESEAAQPLVIAALAAAVRPDDSALNALRAAARDYLNSDAMRRVR